MTREQAVAEAERRQREDPTATWLATRREGEWIVASIGVPPASGRPTGTALKPEPPAPHDEPQSQLHRVTTQFGAGF